jgi:hypothetical protein
VGDRIGCDQSPLYGACECRGYENLRRQFRSTHRRPKKPPGELNKRIQCQFSDGTLLNLSMTRTSTFVFLGSSLNPSCFSTASRNGTFGR